jgi:hypothetical protein
MSVAYETDANMDAIFGTAKLVCKTTARLKSFLIVGIKNSHLLRLKLVGN